MFKSIIDSTGDFNLTIPTGTPVLRVGQTYLAKEASLPPEARVMEPPMAQIQAVYDEASSGEAGKTASEMNRAEISAALSQALSAAEPHLRDALNAIKLNCSSNLALAEQWGLHTKVSRGKVQVYAPAGAAGWEAFLHSYRKKEESLPEPERNTKPPFEVIQKLSDDAAAFRAARTQAITDRRKGVHTRNARLELLQDLLQVAAGVLIARDGCKVTPSLADWGFTVTAVPTKAGGTPVEAMAAGDEGAAGAP